MMLIVDFDAVLTLSRVSVECVCCVADHPRAIIGSGGSRLMIEKVTQEDVLVVQCNASNTHGYIFANAFLNVLG